MEEVVEEEMVPETAIFWQPEKDVAIIIAIANEPHFLNRVTLQIGFNMPFIVFSNLTYSTVPAVVQYSIFH
jgi:hypothetical protein